MESKLEADRAALIAALEWAERALSLAYARGFTLSNPTDNAMYEAMIGARVTLATVQS